MIKCWLRLETRLDYDADVPAFVFGRDQNGGVYITVASAQRDKHFSAFLYGQRSKQQ